MSGATKRPGRPSLRIGDRRSEFLVLRLTWNEKRVVSAAALKNKTTISNYLRDMIVDISRADLNGEL